ncbi:MAG TPA: hypothetical protein VJ599_03960 [Nitrososphaeraceae archaeon]|nr:hypothetical protein [Nitrososphaeraceae archaeon]
MVTSPLEQVPFSVSKPNTVYGYISKYKYEENIIMNRQRIVESFKLYRLTHISVLNIFIVRKLCVNRFYGRKTDLLVSVIAILNIISGIGSLVMAIAIVVAFSFYFVCTSVEIINYRYYLAIS